MRKRILITGGIGFVFGLLCLLQASGVFDWLPEGFFYALHTPALLLAGLFISGERALLLVPLTIVIQWTLVGLLVGVVLHFVYGSKHQA